MIAALVVLAAAIIFAATVAGHLYLTRDPLRAKQRVMVNTREGHGVEGVLVSAGRTWLEIHDATIIPQGSNPANAAKAGVVHLERTEVQWVQVLR